MNTRTINRMKTLSLLILALLLTIGAKAQPWIVPGTGNIYYNGGNVGIGTTSPAYKLQVQKTSIAAPALMISGAYYGGPRIQTYGLDADANAWMGLGTDMAGGPYEHSIYFPDYNGYGFQSIGTYNGTTYSEKMRITRTGNVGIGTTNPGNKLDVNGTIRAKEVKVESGWADYVFDQGYNLQDLSEVELYINEHKHLPEIPDAKEVEKDGVNLGEMNSLLLKKIEELTLYMINQQRQIREIEKTNKVQQKQNELLKQLIKKLENKK